MLSVLGQLNVYQPLTIYLVWHLCTFPVSLQSVDVTNQSGLPVKHMQGDYKLRFTSRLRTDELALRLGRNDSAVRQGKPINRTERQSLPQHCKQAK